MLKKDSLLTTTCISMIYHYPPPTKTKKNEEKKAKQTNKNKKEIMPIIFDTMLLAIRPTILKGRPFCSSKFQQQKFGRMKISRCMLIII